MMYTLNQMFVECVELQRNCRELADMSVGPVLYLLLERTHLLSAIGVFPSSGVKKCNR
jgi:hypothetical protein